MAVFESEIATRRDISFQVRADVWIRHAIPDESAFDGYIIVLRVLVTGQNWRGGVTKYRIGHQNPVRSPSCKSLSEKEKRTNCLI